MAKQKITPTASSPYDYDCILEYQNRGAQILICSDLNARTAEEPHSVRTAELQSFLPTAPDDNELPNYISPRQTRTSLL